MQYFRARPLLPLLILGLGLLAVADTAGATVARYLEMKEHVSLSQLIVRVRAGEAASFLHEKDGRPRTDRVFEILETYKGPLGAGHEITVRQMRGTVGEHALAIPGDAAFAEGEEAVLFLVVDGELAYLTALGQSKYEVVREGEQVKVRRSFDGLAFSDEGRLVEPEPEAPVALEKLEKTIRELVEAK